MLWKQTLRTALLVFITVAASSSKAQDSVETLKVLDRLVGSWKFEFGEKEFRSTGEFNAEWILDGRFIQKKGFIRNPDGTMIRTTSLVTYVADEEKFRTWSFMSNGTTNVGSATWDSEKKVLKEVREDEQFVVTTTTDWSNNNKDSWKMVFTNKSTGDVIRELSGHATKQPSKRSGNDNK